MSDIEQAEENFLRPRRPIVLTVLAILAIAFPFVANYFKGQLSDSIFHFDFAIANFITAASVLVLGIAWVVWLWFISRWSFGWSRILPVCLVLAGVSFLVLFRPIFTGGMGIARWEPRFWQWRKLAELDGEMDSDLVTADAREFPQYLGTDRNGVIKNFNAPLDSFYKMERLYKQDVGNGWSGIIARNGFAITMEQRGDYECVICYEIESGDVAWSYQHPRRFDEIMGQVGPRATPLLDGERVYAQGANGLFVCLDASSGDLIWEKDLSDLLGIELEHGNDSKGLHYQVEQHAVVWGRSGSPLVVDDVVVVQGGGPKDGKQVSLLAFNKLDGKEVWRGGDEGISYASPCLYELDGVKQIVVMNAGSVASYDPKSGSQLWEYARPGNSDADANTSQAVQVSGNRLLVSKGYGMGGELIEVKQKEGVFVVESVWKNSKVLKTKLTNAIVYDGYAFALSDGILECVNLETGKREWKKGRYGHGQVMLVGDKLIIHAEHGMLHMVKATPAGFEHLSEIETVRGTCWNTFCIYDRYILVRSDLEMACFKVDDEG